jgi:uncharacterized repeat protein (TIGR01451 family)/LPXTG-motif cell wall-anchored protein
VVQYTLDISNVADDYVSPAHDLTVTDVLPQSPALLNNSLIPLGVGGVPVSGDGDIVPPDNGVWSQTSRTITWDLSSLEPAGLEAGNSLTLTYDALAADTLLAGVAITNEATVVGSSISGPDPGERDANSPNGGPGSGYQDTATDTVYPPGVLVTKTATPSVGTIGEEITYVATYTFPMDVKAFDATIIDQLPPGITVDGINVGPPDQYTVAWSCVDSLAGNCGPPLNELTPSANGVGWWLGDMTADLTADRKWTIEYRTRIENVPAAVDGAVLTNSFAGYSNESNKVTTPPTQVPDPASYDNKSPDATADVMVVEPKLTLVKEVDDSGTWVDARRALPNESLDYRITVTNTGSAPAYEVIVDDTIVTFSGDAMQLGSVPGGPGYTVTDGDPSDGSLAWSITGPLAPGDSITIPYTLVVWDAVTADENPNGPEIVNTAVGSEYFGVPIADRDPAHPDWYRSYSTTPDNVEIELDLASVGDYVWYDVNSDGVEDLDEPPLGGVEVTVTYLGLDGVIGGGDDEIHVTTTNALGRYLVEDLPGGEYFAAVTGGLPAGVTPSYDLEHGTTNPDGTSEFFLGEDQRRFDVDFGFTGTNALGDLVWWDRNGDGVQDPGEPGIGGVELTVTFFGFDGIEGTPDDVVYPTVTTDGSGIYGVASLPEGTFRATVDTATVPAGMSATYDFDGGQDSTAVVTITGTGVTFTDLDFGYAGNSSIGDRIWFDSNRDGVQDADESGLVGVTVILTWPGPNGILGDADDVDIDMPTGADGIYLFVGLNPGDYQVTVDTATLPPGMAQTYDPDGVLDDTTTVTVVANTDYLDIDFGYAGDGSIGDFVWWDVNADGVQDAGEPGIPNVQLRLHWWGANGIPGDSDDVIRVTSTGTGGLYEFSSLPDGTFDVSVFGALLNSMDPTYDLDGGLDNTANLSLAMGEARTDVDFGYTGTNTIGDTVWYDVDGDGTASAGEPGIPGVTLNAVWFGINGVEGDSDDVDAPPVVTDANGLYLFDNLGNGDYRVTVVANVPAGMTPTYDEDGGLDETTVVSGLTGAVDHDTADFGYTGTGTLGETVWWDLIGDGIQEVFEPDWPGITITVTWASFDGILGTADDVVRTTVTASPWSMSELPAGLFRVAVTRSDLPPDVYQTFSPDGVLNNEAEVVLGAGETNLDQNFGYRGGSLGGPSPTIGDLVWLDSNLDGIQDPGEPGMASVGVNITWLGGDGVPGGGDDVVISLTTDANGIYFVPGLVAGSYEVAIDVSTLPAGLEPHSDFDGGDPAVSSVVLAIEEINLDVDFGLAGSSIGDTVWIDKDGNGIQGPGESGIANAVVRLVDDATGTEVSTTTDTAGKYLFTGVAGGSFTVVIDSATLPDGLVQVYSRDGNLNGQTDVTVVGPSEQLDVDFGYQERKLPVTGIETGTLAIVALALLGVGVVAILITRKRKPTDTA